ncbi:MAG: growth inhibitor PemK [Planctomycetes bacterium RBG_16_64_10]|nr:MAG: growth inhibitor PemK [Planctomycetes bacterium RBG_16_64_10]
MREPLRGEIWSVNLDPIRGREQASRRPALIVSTNLFNEGPAELVVVLPITSREKFIPFHVPIDPPEGGVKTRSFVKCEDIRSISKERLAKPWGTVSAETLGTVADRLRILLAV